MLRYFFRVGSAIIRDLGSLFIGFLNAAEDLMTGYYTFNYGDVEGLVAIIF